MCCASSPWAAAGKATKSKDQQTPIPRALQENRKHNKELVSPLKPIRQRNLLIGLAELCSETALVAGSLPPKPFFALSPLGRCLFIHTCANMWTQSIIHSALHTPAALQARCRRDGSMPFYRNINCASRIVKNLNAFAGLWQNDYKLYTDCWFLSRNDRAARNDKRYENCSWFMRKTIWHRGESASSFQNKA